jgi:hypothetical protein
VPLACEAPLTSRHRPEAVFRRGEVLPGGWVVVDGDGVVVVGEGEGVVLSNWVKNRQTSVLVHVLAPLSPPPSTAPGVWPPSNAAQTTGYPGRQPE